MARTALRSLKDTVTVRVNMSGQSDFLIFSGKHLPVPDLLKMLVKRLGNLTGSREGPARGAIAAILVEVEVYHACTMQLGASIIFTRRRARESLSRERSSYTETDCSPRKRMKTVVASVLTVVLSAMSCTTLVSAIDNGLGRTPP